MRRASAEFRDRSRLGGRRAAASGARRTLPGGLGSGGAARALRTRAPGRQRRRKRASLRRSPAALDKLINKTFWLARQEALRVRAGSRTSRSTNPACWRRFRCGLACSRGSCRPDDHATRRADHQADWGMRIISDSSRYSGGGYHYGSVWPLFTGWASVGEYRYHRALPAYANLRANALLGARRLARAFHRSSVRRLLPVVLHQFAAPDLVRGHGRSVRCCAACSGCRSTRKRICLHWRRTFPQTGHFAVTNIHVGGVPSTSVITAPKKRSRWMPSAAARAIARWNSLLRSARGRSHRGGNERPPGREPCHQERGGPAFERKVSLASAAPTSWTSPCCNDFGVSVPTSLPALGSEKPRPACPFRNLECRSRPDGTGSGWRQGRPMNLASGARDNSVGGRRSGSKAAPDAASCEFTCPREKPTITPAPRSCFISVPKAQWNIPKRINQFES